MNWYKISKRKYKDERQEGDKMDTSLLCCNYPENRRKNPYKKKKSRNYPKNKYNETKNIEEWSKKKCTNVIVPPLLSG